MPSCKLSIFILFDCIIQISEWAPSQPYWYNHDYLAWFQKEIVQGLFIQSCKHVYQSYFWKSNSIDLESTERWLKKFRTEICIMNSYTDILQVKWMIFFFISNCKCTGTGPVWELNLGPLNLWADAVPIELYGAPNDQYGTAWYLSWSDRHTIKIIF